MAITPEEKLMYHVMKAIYDCGIPISFKGSMVLKACLLEAIRLYITGTKFRNITGDPELTDVQVLIITELLDEMSPKGVLKEFNSEIRKSLKAAK